MVAGESIKEALFRAIELQSIFDRDEISLESRFEEDLCLSGEDLIELADLLVGALDIDMDTDEVVKCVTVKGLLQHLCVRKLMLNTMSEKH